MRGLMETRILDTEWMLDTVSRQVVTVAKVGMMEEEEEEEAAYW